MLTEINQLTDMILSVQLKIEESQMSDSEKVSACLVLAKRLKDVAAKIEYDAFTEGLTLLYRHDAKMTSA